jgi:hypothetical protein
MAWQSEHEKIFKKLKPILGAEKIHKLWLAYQTSPDYKSRAEILGVLHILASKYLKENYEKQILLSLPPRDLIKGEYPFGIVSYGGKYHYPFGLRENEFPQHVFIAGRSGSGKTNTAFVLISALMKNGKPFLVTDWKNSYRRLSAHPEFRDIEVYTVDDENPFYWNPFAPLKSFTKRRYKNYLRKIISVFLDSYFPGLNLLTVGGVESLLIKAMEDLTDTKDVIKPIDILNWLKRYRTEGFERNWQLTAMNIMSKLCSGYTDLIFNCERSMELEEILRKPVIIELAQFGTEGDKKFFIYSLLVKLYNYRLMEKDCQVFKHALFLEEAHNLLGSYQTAGSKEGILETIIRQIRELGEALIIIDQSPSLIPRTALGNTYCVIAMSLRHRSDVTAMADALLLDYNQRDFIGKLEVGWAIIKLQGRWLEPFLINIPLVSPPDRKEIGDIRLKSRNAGYSLENELIRAKELINDLEKEVRSYVNKEEENIQITDEERKFLEDIFRHPISGVVQRYQRMGINAFSGNRMKNSLLEKGLIYWKPVSTMNGRIKVLLLTHKGKTAIGKTGEDKIFPRNTSFEHEYWKYKIAEIYRKKGYKVTPEYSIDNGKKVDIAAEKDGKRIAIEIETGKSDAIYNIQKDLGANFDEVVSIFLTKEHKDKIISKLKEIGLDKEKRIKVLDIYDQF